jgi:hypothetical protein
VLLPVKITVPPPVDTVPLPEIALAMVMVFM